MEPKNIKEFKALVERYETIMIEEIVQSWTCQKSSFRGIGDTNARTLTGFSDTTTCSLCTAISKQCEECVYACFYGCVKGCNAESYNLIENATTPETLLSAFRDRAKHLRKTYPQYL